ncbi:MAG: hypothetical protein AAGN46_10250 [Acidobacteriota bacterium]
MTSRRLFACWTLIVVLLTAPASAANQPPDALDEPPAASQSATASEATERAAPDDRDVLAKNHAMTDRLTDDLPWTRLRFQARKLFFGGDAQVTLAGEADDRARIDLSFEAFGRESRNRLWFDPRTGAAQQEEKLKIGSDAELRRYEYGLSSAVKIRYHERPEAEAEAALDTWSEKSRQVQHYGSTASPAPGSPAALLYRLATSELNATGDRTDVLLFTKERLVHAVAEVIDEVEWQESFLLHDGERTREIERPIDALLIRVESRSLTGDAIDLDLFGLEGDLEILLEPRRRLPLELRGGLPIAGRVRVQLHEAWI